MQRVSTPRCFPVIRVHFPNPLLSVRSSVTGALRLTSILQLPFAHQPRITIAWVFRLGGPLIEVFLQSVIEVLVAQCQDVMDAGERAGEGEIYGMGIRSL